MQNKRKVVIIDYEDIKNKILKEQIELTGEFDAYYLEDRNIVDAHEIYQVVMQKNPEILLYKVKSNESEIICSHIEFLRDKAVNFPIIILFDDDEHDNVIDYLNAGANDVVDVPFRISILVARMRAHLRQYDRSSDAVLTIGPYLLKQDNGILIDQRSDKKIRLTEKESNIIKHLYRAAPDVVPRKMLLNEVWGFTNNVSTHTLETHIYRLRKKIEPDPNKISLLVTESKGYRLKI